MAKAIRLLHCADLHLGTPFHSLARHLPSEYEQRLRRSSTELLRDIVELAKREQVDAVCIVGDLFDEADTPVSTQFEVQRQFQTLYQAGIPVVLVHGNHDPFGKPPLFRWPENVKVLANQETRDASVTSVVLPIDDRSVQFSGFSYPSNELYGSKVHDFVRHPDADLCVALYHGQVGGGLGKHKAYAAASLTEMIQHREIDVWLLGHIHQYQLLHEAHPFILYPGSPLGRDMSETGPHGVALIEVDTHGRVTHSFAPLANVEWVDLTVDISEAQDLNAVLASVSDACGQLSGTSIKLAHVTVVGLTPIYDKLSNDDVRQSIQEVVDADGSQVFVHRLTNTSSPDIDLDTLKRSDGYIGELLTMLEAASLDAQDLLRQCEEEWSEDEFAFLCEVMESANGSLDDVLRETRQLVVASMDTGNART